MDTYADYSNYYGYLADGTKVQHDAWDGPQHVYYGSLVYDQGSFESASFGGGRIVGTYDDSEAHYFLTDHIGSTRVVAKVTAAGRDDLDRKDYYPFGKAWTQAGMPMSENRYTFSGKEQVDVAIEDGITTPIHDFGARYYDSDGALFFQQDPMLATYYHIGPYCYCTGNPINRIDTNGNWDVSVHVYNNREKYGYGIAIVTNRQGKEVFRFTVRAEGTGGRNRYKSNSDTPLGIYDIPDNEPWITGGSRSAYGPNHRLNMVGQEGEIIDTGRSLIRIHGGRQEKYNPQTGQWEKIEKPILKKTYGCLRASDEDMKKFKQITDLLQSSDSEEIPGIVSITDDLQAVDEYENKVTTDIKVTFQVPAEELDYWKNFISNLLN